MKQQKSQLSNSVFVIGCLALISVLFATVQIQQSLFSGQLAFPITYDDIVYFTAALRRLNRFYEDGLARLFLDYIQAPPHSPTSVFTSLLGFILFGQHDWAPAAANTIWLFGFLCFIAYITSEFSNFYRIVFFAIALSSPITGHLVIESRPDILAGLSTACGVFLIFRTRDLDKRNSIQFFSGIAISLAFLSKPTISPVTLIIFLSTLALKIVDSIYLKKRNNDAVKKLNTPSSYLEKMLFASRKYLIICTTVAVLLLPHYILNFRTIFQYIYLTIFGDYKELWQLKGSFSDQFLFYLTGQGGRMMFGDGIILLPLVILLTLSIAIAKKDWDSIKSSLPYVLINIITFSIVTIPSTKSPFLGMAFGSMVFLSVLHLLGYSVRVLEFHLYSTTASRAFCRFICITLVIVNLGLFQWPWYGKGHATSIQNTSMFSAYERELLNSVSQELKEDVENKLPNYTAKCAPYINLITTTSYLTPEVLEYTLLKQGITNITVFSKAWSNDFMDVWEYIEKSDYLLTFSRDYPGMVSWYPGNKFIPRILKKIEKNDNLTLLKSFTRPESLGGGEVFLYSSSQQSCKPIPPQVLLR